MYMYMYIYTYIGIFWLCICIVSIPTYVCTDTLYRTIFTFVRREEEKKKRKRTRAFREPPAWLYVGTYMRKA